MLQLLEIQKIICSFHLHLVCTLTKIDENKKTMQDFQKTLYKVIKIKKCNTVF